MQSRYHQFMRCRVWAPQAREVWKNMDEENVWVETPEGTLLGQVAMEGDDCGGYPGIL